MLNFFSMVWLRKRRSSHLAPTALLTGPTEFGVAAHGETGMGAAPNENEPLKPCLVLTKNQNTFKVLFSFQKILPKVSNSPSY